MKHLLLFLLAFSECAWAGPRTQRNIVTFSSIPNALTWFESEEQKIPRNDRRSLFLRAYHTVTEEMEVLFQENYFQNPVWVRKLVLKFASLYRDALECEEMRGNCPANPVWRYAFFENQKNTKLASIQFFLSLSAHINRDMPVALAEADTDFASESERHDFEAITAVYIRRMPELIRLVQEYEYCQVNPMGEEIIKTFMPVLWGHTRNEAWKWASRLAEVQNAEEEAKLLHGIESHAWRDNFYINTFAPLPAEIVCRVF